MTNETKPVTLPREVVGAIEAWLSEYNFDKWALLEHHCDKDGEWGGRYRILNDVSTETLARALVNGYEVEPEPPTPLEQAREYLRNTSGKPAFSYEIGCHHGARTMAEILSAQWPEIGEVLRKAEEGDE